MADQYQAMVTSETLPTTNPPLFAGSAIGRVQRTIVILTGQAALPRGTVMGKITASGKYVGLVPAASDGSEVPVGVLGEDTPAAAADITSYMYVTGQFNVALLKDGAGVAVTTAHKATLQALNIYAETVYG